MPESTIGMDNTYVLSKAERRTMRRRRRWTKRIAFGTVLAGLAMGAWAFEAGSEGLKGIFPEEVPAGLSAEAFQALGPTWANEPGNGG